MDSKYKKILEQMTIDEKISMLSGANFWNTQNIDRLNIKSIMLTDGPHGLRKQGGASDHLGLNASIPATAFPTAATIANSWNKDLVREMGVYLGSEAKKENVATLLGPGINIKRNPLGGRNFEYFSEDPYLTGILAKNMIEGIESTGVSSCPKHFAVNSQEKLRMTIDEIVDQRALHEIYLEGFRYAIKAKPKTLMTSYNKVNGVYANEHSQLLIDILRKEWKYDGIVVTDWGGNNDRVEALKVKNQLEMPSSGGITDKEIKNALENNEISESIIDDNVLDMLRYVDVQDSTTDVFIDFDLDKFHNKAQEVAQDSIVLLKNENILPLNKNNKIGVIGDFARTPRYQGAGSSLINPSKLVSPLEAFIDDEFNITGFERGFRRYGNKSNRLLKRSVKLAKKSDFILYFMGLDESSETEGLDRLDINVKQNQIDTLKAIYEVNQNIIIVLSGGSSIDMEFDKYAKGVIHTYLSGQAVGSAVSKIITGEVNPSGKLAETYAYKLEDHLSSKYYPGNELTAEHRESIYVGYRYFETANIDVKYPFGYGLSYSNFLYSNLKINKNIITFEVTNTSNVGGSEIAQLYISAKNSKTFRAKMELKGFEKHFIEPSETIEYKIELDDYAFKYFNIENNDFDIEDLEYEILIGSSIKDIHLAETIKINGKQKYPINCTDYEYLDLMGSISSHAFEKLCGYKLPSPKWDRSKKLTLNDTIAQSQYQGIMGKMVYKSLLFINKMLLFIDKPIVANYVFFIIYMPWRQVSRFSNNQIKETTVQKFLNIL